MKALEISPTSWRKSSHSGEEGTECVEVTPALWRKSTRSGEEGTQCVEVAVLTHD